MMNKKRYVLAFATLAALALMIGCSKTATTNAPATTAVDRARTPSALPDNAFKAIITLVDPPAKLRAGEKATVSVKVKNGSDVLWYARGAQVNPSSDSKFILAAGNRWLNGADEKLVTDMDGRYGLNKDLQPGQETEVPLLITAPKEPGEYVLEVDLVQEQVAWFRDKGSATAKTKVTVVR